jgi:hypothetical protein
MAVFFAIAQFAFAQGQPNDSQTQPQKKRVMTGQAGSGPVSAHWVVAPDIDARLAKWKSVELPFHSAGMSAREKEMIGKLVEASQALESIYWRQSDPEGLHLYHALNDSQFTRDKKVKRLLFINGGRYDLLDNNQPFVGTEPFYPGRGLYPTGLTRQQIEDYVKAHPEKKDEIYNPQTVVRRQGEDLVGVPYHIVFRPYLQHAARALRQAAALSSDAQFAGFLRARADALLTDDYYKSDIAWLELKDPKVDIIFAPYETYLDDLLGVKTSYGAAVMIRNEAESKKLAVYQQYVPDIQEALPLAAEDKPSKKGQVQPMEVVDAPFRAGDLNHGYQAVADNLPNDPRIHQEKGTKKLFFKNFMDARVNNVIIPVAAKMMRADQVSKVTGDGYLTHTILHEISHGIGPAFARMNGKQVDIRETIGPTYAGLEEAKADVVGMYGLIWLMNHGALPKDRDQEFYASYLGGIFRTVRYGVAEAHGRAEMMEFNYLSEQKVITRDASGKYAVEYAKMPDAIAALAKELLEIEATGDRARAEAWFAKYKEMPTELKESLKATEGIPVDIEPQFSFKTVVR